MLGGRHGFAGLMKGHLSSLGPRDVGGIVQRGGTVLGSARCPEFTTSEGLDGSCHTISNCGIDGLIVIGGNGSQLGRWRWPVEESQSSESHRRSTTICTGATSPSASIPRSTSPSKPIDRLKVTASSHQRAFLVEVMGRQCGYLALMAGLAVA